MSMLQVISISGRCMLENNLTTLASNFTSNSNIISLTVRSITNSKVINALPPKSVINVFDRKAKVLQKERAARLADAKSFSYIKDEVGYRLVDRIFDIKKKFKKALDLGCGHGHVSKNILNESVEELILTDTCETLVMQAEVTEGIKTERKVIDEENFLFEPNSLDLVISNLSLHWVNDLPRCFSQIIDSLKNDGVFLATFFGGDTLYELRCSLQLAELERDGGISPHVSPFIKINDVGNLLTRAGFTMLTIDVDEIIGGYPSIFELMRDLKGMGENNAARNRKMHLKRDTMLAASAIYEQLYGKTKDDGTKYVPATFQIIYLIGWKPDVSQPKPLERGTGEVSLKDLAKLDEIAKERIKVKTNSDK